MTARSTRHLRLATLLIAIAGAAIQTVGAQALETHESVKRDQVLIAPRDVIPLGGVNARAAALLLSGQSGGEVEGAVVWACTGLDPSGARAEIVVLLEVDGRSLLETSDASRVPLEVYGYLVSAAGAVVEHVSDGLLLDRGPLRAAVAAGGLRLVARFAVAPDLYSLRMLVRNRVSGRFLLVSRDLDLRLEDRTEPLLLPPLAVGNAGSWVVAGHRGADPAELEERVSEIDGWPAARPSWRADRSLELVLAGSELGDRLRLSSRLIDGLGRRLLDPEITVEQRLETRGVVHAYRTTVEPPDLPAGSYRFVVELSDADTGSAVTQSMTVVIHDLDRELAWTDPDAPHEARAAPLPGPPRDGVIDIESETIQGAYVEALRLWADGAAIAARRELAELEHPLESSASTRAWRQLINVERVTIMKLAREDPRSLAAVAMLHRDMYDWYRARTEPQLARHSWKMAAMAARLAARLWQAPLAAEFSECLLIDLAGRLVSAGQPRSAHELLDGALDVAPGSAPALLGLGALLERTGAPAEAAEIFERLLQQHPERLDGRLRLAVTSARSGATRRAEAMFRELTDGSSPRWVRAVASQELARLLIDRGDLGEAEAVLDEAIAAVPENQRLRLQRGFVLDLAGRPAEAAATVESIRALGARQGTSPRYTYSIWPDLDGDRVRAVLRETLELALAGLRESIS